MSHDVCRHVDVCERVCVEFHSTVAKPIYCILTISQPTLTDWQYRSICRTGRACQGQGHVPCRAKYHPGPRTTQHCRVWRQTFSTTTAVPYAKISEAPAATELEVILTPTIALAPRSAACVFIRSVASARASLSKSV